jgi:DNA-binding phage protein
MAVSAMTPTDTTPSEPSEHLDSPEAVAAHLIAALEDGNEAVIMRAVTDIGYSLGLPVERLREDLLADGGPRLSTFLELANSLGLKVAVRLVE